MGEIKLREYQPEKKTGTFIMMPGELFFSESFCQMSNEAKLLYALMLDKMSLSAKNGFRDENGKIYIIFPIATASNILNCGKEKTCRLYRELSESGLIQRKRRGLGAPDLIYVRMIASSDKEDRTSNTEVQKQAHCSNNLKKSENQTSGVRENRLSESADSDRPYTNILDKITILNQTDRSILPIHPEQEDDRGHRHPDEESYGQLIRRNIGFDALISTHPGDERRLEEIVSIMAEVCASESPYIVISGERKPRKTVSSVFLKFSYSDMEYVLRCLDENTAKIRNPKSYLLTVLYNAHFTRDNYYSLLYTYNMSCMSVPAG